MKIAIFSHYFLPEIGAPSARISDFASQWLDDGNEVHVVTCFPNHPSGVVYPGYRKSCYHHELLSGIHVHRIWTYFAANTGFIKRSLAHISFWLSSRANVYSILPKMDCVIGTSPTLFAAMAARDCARRQHIPFIMEVRDLWPAVLRDLGVAKNPYLIRYLERLEMSLYRDATRIITLTESFRNNITVRGFPSTKVTTITNGASIDFWTSRSIDSDPLRTSLSLRDKYVVLYMGTHGISQRLSTLLRVANELHKYDDLAFLFIGAGAERDKLINEVRTLRLKNVHFIEAVDRERAREYYALADVCFVPLRDVSLFRGFIPSKIFEIMSMERPIIASVAGEAADILLRSGAAFVVPPEDASAVAGAVVKLKSNREQGKAMGIAGRRFVIQHYDRKLLARRYLSVLQESQHEECQSV